MLIFVEFGLLDATRITATFSGLSSTLMTRLITFYVTEFDLTSILRNYEEYRKK